MYLLEDPEQCLAAVTQNGAALQYVPWRYKKRELCSIAVTNCPTALRFVPLKLRTMELCTAAFAANYEVVENIPEKILVSSSGFEMCLSAARQDGLILKLLPRNIMWHDRVSELHMAAVTQNGMAINYVTDFVLGHIPPDICLAAVTQNGMVLDLIPYRFITIELCRAAVAQNPDALRYVPEHFLDLIEGTILDPEIVSLPEDLDISEMDDPVGLEPLTELKNTVYGFVEHAPGNYVPAGPLEMFRNLISNRMFKCTRTELFVAQFNRTEHISKFVWCTLP